MKDISILSESKSNLLDTFRWVSALLVLWEHVYMLHNNIYKERLTDVFVLDFFSYFAHNAVIVFFVLSGYLIFYTVDKKDNYKFKDYFIDRFSRIYSVLILAIIFTIFLDYIGGLSSINYQNIDLVPQDNQIVRFFINLFSMQGIQGYRVQLGSNPALWSIGYEFTFYIVFGLLYFGYKMNKKYFYIIAISILVLMGLKLTIYMFVWLMGGVSYILSKKIKIILSKYVLFIFPILTVSIIQYLNIYTSFDEYSKDMILASVLACLFLFDYRINFSKIYKKVNKYLSQYSYTIYAFHMPIIFYIFSIHINIALAYKYILVFILVLIMSRLFYKIGEEQRYNLKKFTKRVINSEKK